MKNIFFLRFGPTSKIIGNIIDPWWFQKNGFNVHFWDISSFFYSEASDLEACAVFDRGHYTEHSFFNNCSLRSPCLIVLSTFANCLPACYFDNLVNLLFYSEKTSLAGRITPTFR